MSLMLWGCWATKGDAVHLPWTVTPQNDTWQKSHFVVIGAPMASSISLVGQP